MMSAQAMWGPVIFRGNQKGLRMGLRWMSHTYHSVQSTRSPPHRYIYFNLLYGSNLTVEVPRIQAHMLESHHFSWRNLAQTGGDWKKGFLGWSDRRRMKIAAFGLSREIDFLRGLVGVEQQKCLWSDGGCRQDMGERNCIWSKLI